MPRLSRRTGSWIVEDLEPEVNQSFQEAEERQWATTKGRRAGKLGWGSVMHDESSEPMMMMMKDKEEDKKASSGQGPRSSRGGSTVQPDDRWKKVVNDWAKFARKADRDCK